MIRDIETGLLDARSDARNLNAARVEALAESIADTGLINPIRVRAKADGRFEVIAGMHRLAAHRILGLAEIPAIVVDDDDLHAELAMIDENLIREELTPVDRARSIARRKEIYETLFPDTVAGVAGGKARQGSAGDKLSFAEDTARATGRDMRTIQRDAARGARIADDVMDFIRSTPLNTGLFLDRIKNLAPAEQMRTARAELARIDAAERARRQAKQDGKKQKRSAREAELAGKIASLPDKRYGVILADPEWRFEPYSRDSGMDRAADNHYPTSTVDAIAARPVADIAADDCVLFLWATPPMLPQALTVMAAWGFAYKSHTIWRKAEIDTGENVARRDRGRYSTGLVLGTGYWFRFAHELLLVGTRGNVPAPAMGDQFPSVIDAAPLRHSQKPDRFHELIEAYFPNLPKIELNARAARAGWDAWGLEAPGEPIPLDEADDGTNDTIEFQAKASVGNGATGGDMKDPADSPSGEASRSSGGDECRRSLSDDEANAIIEAAYAAGEVDLKALAAETGLSPATIRNRAWRRKWASRENQKAASRRFLAEHVNTPSGTANEAQDAKEG